MGVRLLVAAGTPPLFVFVSARRTSQYVRRAPNTGNERRNKGRKETNIKENDVWKNTLVDAGDIDSVVSAFKLALYQDLLKSYVLAASAWNWIEKEFAPADPDPYSKMLGAMRAAIRAYLDEHRDALKKITAYEPNHKTRWLVAANEVRTQNLGFYFDSVIQPDVLCDLKSNSAFVYEVTGEWPARKNEDPDEVEEATGETKTEPEQETET